MASKEDRKRERERIHLEAFRAAYPDFPSGVIQYAGRPDFTVALGSGQKLGIEHTEFLRESDDRTGSALRMRESRQDKVVRKAREAYERRGLPLVDVLLHWAPYDDIVPSRLSPLAEEIAEAVVAQAPGDGRIELESTGMPDSPVPAEVSILRIQRLAQMTKSHWNSARSDYVPNVTTAEVQRVLARKEANLLEYRKACARVWLLIVADGLAPSSLGEVEDLRKERFASSFDDVFFFRFFERDVLRLAVSPP
jgi:hypothetical protein